MTAELLICWATIISGQQPAASATNPPSAAVPLHECRRGFDDGRVFVPGTMFGPRVPFGGFGDAASAFSSAAFFSQHTHESRFGPARLRFRRTVRESYYPGFFGSPFGHYGCETTYSSFGFVGSPFGFGPLVGGGYDPFGPTYVGPAYVGQSVIVVPPPVVVVAPPVQFVDPRVPVAAPLQLPAALPRNATTDIPLELVDQLIQRRRPTLAQRAQSAKLEGGGDRLFRAGHFDRAAERYEQALVQTSDNDDLSFKRGAALAATGQYDEAGRVLRDALRERPDWPYVAHDLRQFFPDDDSIRRTLDALDRESRRPNADSDVPFLRAYILYFTGQRDASAAIFRNPPEGGPMRHFQVFADAIDRNRPAR